MAEVPLASYVERNTCYACGSTLLTELWNFEEVTIIRCNRCTLYFTRPIPDEENLTKFYSEFYPETSGEFLCDSLETRRTHSLMNYVRRRLSVEQPKLLDVGSSYGFVLREAVKRGWEAYGVEVSADLAEFSRGFAGGAQVFSGPIEKAPFGRGEFDAITLFNVLEHLRDPISTLRRLSLMIKPTGKLFALVPNSNCVLARAFGPNWPWVAPPFHLYYFNSLSIRRCFVSAGLRCTELDTLQGDAYNAPTMTAISLFRFLLRRTRWPSLSANRIGLRKRSPTIPVARYVTPLFRSPCPFVKDAEIMAVATPDSTTSQILYGIMSENPLGDGEG